MKLDLSCPVEIRGYSLSCENGRSTATIRLYNLESRRVSAIEAAIKWRSALAQKSILCPFDQRNLHARGEDFFEITLSTHHLPDANAIEPIIKAVFFEEGDAWHASNGPFVEIESLPAISDASLSQLRATVGNDAVRFPVENETTWNCLCGRINSRSTQFCVRCHRSHDDVMVITPDSISSAAEADDHSIEALYGQYVRRRSRTMRRIALMFGTALVIALLLIGNEAPKSIAGSAEAPPSFEFVAVHHPE